VFCAGQDLGEHAAALREEPETAFATLAEHYIPIVTALMDAPKPVVAAINGTCAGAGLSLALACDIRLAAAEAKFATAFTGIGLSFDSGLSATLARAVGAARASELIMLGEPFSAQDALAWGLVGRVVPAAELAGQAAALAGKLAAGPTLAFAAAKRAIIQSFEMPIAEVLATETRVQQRLGLTRDHRQAVEAFLAKQRPVFTGRD
jgi:2-(1,2-epoxy-1,2-dihydrophenyl)acetyl-CoA isomerase